jgi:hypothetical protein
VRKLDNGGHKEVAGVQGGGRGRGTRARRLVGAANDGSRVPRHVYPGAKRVLLVSQGDSTTREPLLRSTALGEIDYYVVKPWRLPDEAFHRVVTEFLDEWTSAHRPRFVALRVVGERWSARSHEIRDLWSRSRVPLEFHAADSEVGKELLGRWDVSPDRLPVVIIFDQRAARLLAKPGGTGRWSVPTRRPLALSFSQAVGSRSEMTCAGAR